jgi:DNA repair protein RadC
MIGAPDNIYDVVRPLLENSDREMMLALYLDTRNRLIGIHTVSVGTLNATTAQPREVFKAALLLNAATVVLAHNHPSGDPTPSADDVAVTARVRTAGETLGVSLLDHVIVGAGRYVSLSERNLL